ncbi:DUF6933 domain-containing protein [Pseudomonas nunensis]|uniref:DUF6933 domain-containing protein n=1 Tax=Pseudomonas nunensis TaxID=2961896 RepID=UPI0006B578CB|nr:hypothetical protein [Pseudomonas nunensis]KOY03389.1 hypothetical protein AM274_03125 [Pseudomonas nunensis]
MLIFNCTEAASQFFSRVQKGKAVTPVDFNPPSTTPEEDEPGDSVEQWLVHAITVQRKHVLIVMHIETRYCMIFAGAKKADVAGFIQRFSERWIYGLMRHATQNDLFPWIDGELMQQRYEQACSEHVFYKRRHRSAQKHIDEISWIFQDYAAEWGELPSDEYVAGRFDAQMNKFLRLNKVHKDYRAPDEEMIAHWLRAYSGQDEQGVQAARDRLKEVRRQALELERN